MTQPDNPDKRNSECDCKYAVRVYFKTGREHTFPARNLQNAQDIAGRCVREYVWIANDDGTFEYFPTTEIHKVKVIPREV